MNLSETFQQILELYCRHSNGAAAGLNAPATPAALQEAADLLQEPLPESLTELYVFANGEETPGTGVFLGLRFLPLAEVCEQLRFSRSLVKPVAPFVPHPEQAANLLQQLVDFTRSHIPRYRFPGIRRRWHKLEFSCGVNMVEGPYLYNTEGSGERTLLELKHAATDQMTRLVQTLHGLEQEAYNWDQLHIKVYADGRQEVERSFYNFDNDITFTSVPENAIRKKYFHSKWVPLFSDYGGNYLGMDLDPGVAGTRGQVINFGRDEEQMQVLGQSLHGFLQLVLQELQQPGTPLLEGKRHQHDVLKELLHP